MSQETAGRVIYKFRRTTYYSLRKKNIKKRILTLISDSSRIQVCKIQTLDLDKATLIF